VQPLSLSTQAGLVTLELIHQNCVKLENNYFKCWLPELNKRNREYEERLDCSKLDMNSVVVQYQARFKARRRTAREGIPCGAPGGHQAYIKYRKCLQVFTLSKWRESLMSQAVMTPEMMSGLMDLAGALYRPSKDRLEPGALTLQSLLTCQWTERLHTLSTGYRSNFRAYGWESRDWRLEEKDTRLGHSLLVSSLSQATRLKQLSLERLATDQMMEVVSQHCPLLTYLNISSSKVTDLGLLQVAGVQAGEEELRRPRLERECKARPGSEASGEAGVRNVTVRWRSVAGRGCSRLSHLEAENLLSLHWPRPHLQYKDCPTVPLDCGFVALLDSLPLTVLNTEVAGRAVLAWSKLMKKLGQSRRRLELEVLVDSRPSESLLQQAGRLCPRLREVRVDWAQFVPDNKVSREAWLPGLSSLPLLQSVVTSEIDHKSQALDSLLKDSSLGARLTNLHLQELWSLNFSLLAAIKDCCTSLQRLVIFLTVKDWTGPLGAMAGLHIEKDAELEVNTGNLRKVREVHLMGPFPSSVTRYLLDSSPDLETLTLSVDWPEPACCNILPDMRLDYLGTNYMKQVLAGNSLAKVKELHLMTQYSRGKKYLDSDFAQFIMKSLPSLEHLGCFRCWNMTLRQRREARQAAVSKSLNIVVDQDTKPRPSENVGDFRNIFDPDKMKSSCLWLPVKPMSTFSFFEEVAEMFVGPDNIWPPDFPGLEDNGNIGGNNFELSDSSDEESDGEEQEPQVGLEPICSIM